MRVLGIDPGSRVTGYGIVEHEGRSLRHVDNGGLATHASLPLPQRLQEIYAGLTRLIAEYRPDVVVVEDIFVAANARSSLLLGQARGVALLAASNAGIAIAEYAPAQVKQAVVGQGRASKHQIQQMVRTIMGLPEIAHEDASDALAVAICHCQTAGLKERIEGVIARSEATKQPPANNRRGDRFALRARDDGAK